MDTGSLMEQILSSDNLNRAYLQVVRNKGADGKINGREALMKQRYQVQGDYDILLRWNDYFSGNEKKN